MTTRGRELRKRSREVLATSRATTERLRRAWLAAAAPEPVSGDVLAGPPRWTRPAHIAKQALPARPGPREGTETVLSAICGDLALRDLNLVDLLHGLLERLEEREEDPGRLDQLYQLDHLTARLRRNAENLRVLAGHDASLVASDNQPLVDVIRAAMSPIDHYDRVEIGSVVGLGVVGFAAEDVERVLTELLDNATKSSPPSAPVRVGVHLTENGSTLVRVEDDGIGVPPDRLGDLNRRLDDPPTLDDDAVRHMGLAVVRRLAARHEIRVWLEPRHPRGTTASMLLPATLVCELPKAGWSGSRTVTATPAAARRPAVAHRAAGSGAAGRSTSGTGLGVASSTPSRWPVPANLAADRAARGRDAATAGTTPTGLPRRVPRSLKAGADPVPATPPPPTTAAGREQLLADLDAFSQGEREARQEPREA